MYDLGLTSRQFWNLTPAQFFALLDRAKFEIRRSEMSSAVVAKTVADVNRPEDHPGYEIEMFMPSAPKPKKEKLTAEMLWDKCKFIFGRFTGG